MIKQVIVMRKDLHMRRGKEIAQGSHSSMMFLIHAIKDYNTSQAGNEFPEDTSEFSLTDIQQQWIDGLFTKVCLQVNSEEELLEIHRKALSVGLESHLIQDAGKTEFGGVPTYTCLAIGPDDSEKIDLITGNLKLY